MYTLASFLSVVVVVIADKILSINLFRNKKYYFFLLIIFGFKLLVNGALTASIVMYNPAEITGIRLFTIPIEDFGFGLSMVTLAVMVWEKTATR